MTYDALIIGAGPSGSYLAYLLARSGLRVLLCDRAAFPREKTCGGGISQKTIDLLQFDISSVVERRLKGALLTYRNRDTVIKDLGNRSGVAVLRARFDNLIVEHAQNAGAIFRPECAFEGARRTGDTLEVETGGGTFTARYLVGADGVFSSVRKELFGRDIVAYAPAVEAWIYVPPSVIDGFEDRVLFDFGGMPRGYGWIFPKKDHLNVGVFSLFRTRDINADLRKFIARYTSLGSYDRIEYRGHAIPLKNRKRLFQNGNVLLVGDAAGFAESFYGEGIYFGLKSAVLAAQALGRSTNGSAGKTYADLVGTQMLPDLRYSELNARLFFSVQKFGFYRMVRNNFVNHNFAELIAGTVGHRECFYRTLFTLPYWLSTGNPLPSAGRIF